MGQLEDLEARRAKLETRLAEVKRQQREVERDRAARQGAAERKEDTHRKCATAGALLILLRGNPQLLGYLRRVLLPMTRDRDRPAVIAFLDSVDNRGGPSGVAPASTDHQSSAAA